MDMIDRASQFIDLMLDIGADNIGFFIAIAVFGLLIVFSVLGVGIIVVVFIPVCVVVYSVKLIIWLCQKGWRHYHPRPKSERNIVSKRVREKDKEVLTDEELPPVYPSWMSHKGGRLL